MSDVYIRHDVMSSHNNKIAVRKFTSQIGNKEQVIFSDAPIKERSTDNLKTS